MLTSAAPSRLEILVGNLGVHQDFFWFAALLAWSFTLIAWWRAPRAGTGWGWLPWAAGAGAASAFVAFCVFNPPLDFFYERLVPGTTSNYVPALIDPNVFGDVALGCAFAAMIAGWLWQALSGRPRAVRWLALTAVTGVAVWQGVRPQTGGVVLSLLAPAVAIGWILARRRTAGLSSRVALGFAAALPALSTVGPLAWLVDAAQRRGPPTPLGAFFALVEIVAALFALAGLLARAATEPKTRSAGTHLWREARPVVWAGTVWLLAGLTFAIITGRNEAHEVKTNRLRTAAARAATFDAALVGDVDRFFVVPEAARRGAQARLQQELESIVRSTPFLTAARILVLRDGDLVAIAAAPKPVEGAPRLRRATPDDLRHWDDGRPYNEYSAVPEAGAPYYCRAPLRDAAGRTVGWLEFVREEFYSSMDRKWRTAPLLVTALVLIIGTFVAMQRAAARERMIAQNAAAVAAEANRMKTAFLAKVSHELRTPLQSILGYCELLQADQDPARRAARLAALRQHSDLMLRLVNDLLDLSTIEAGAFRFSDRPVSLGDVGGQTVESLRPRAEAKGLSLSWRLGAEVPPWLETDPERWRQIILNLVGNAIKFTAAGGVRVELDVLEQDASAATVELAVTDTGPGIALRDQARLFQTFSRLELTAQHEGVGLGLALVAALCRGAGGDVSVTSDGRHGSCFRVRLRLRTAPDPGVSARPVNVSALAGRRILIADDNALVRELFADHLSACGAECDTVADGEAAVTAVESGGYDALIVDLAMPGLDGFAVAQRLRLLPEPRPRIVGVSAHAGAIERRRALESGMDAFLAKPVPLADLAAALGAGPLAGEATVEAGSAGRMQQLFRSEAPRQIRELNIARSQSDWPDVRARVHWLRNSAVVLGELALVDALGELERVAEAGDDARFDAAWPAVRRQLEAAMRR